MDAPTYEASARVIGYTDLEGNPIDVAPGIYYGDGGRGSNPQQGSGGALVSSRDTTGAGGGLFEGFGAGIFGLQDLHLPCIIPVALRKDPAVCDPATNGLVWLALVVAGVYIYANRGKQ